MKNIAWIDTNGCPNGNVQVLHVDNAYCEASECGVGDSEE